MPRYRIDVGEVPRGGSIDVFWRRPQAPNAKLGTYGTPVVEVDVPDLGDVVFEVVPRSESGVRGPSRTWAANTYTDKPADREAVKDLTIPAPEVRLKDGVLEITPQAPAALGRGERLDYEMRVSEPEEDESAAVFVGEIKAGETAQVNAWPVDNMTVHVRPIYPDTGEAGDWTTATVQTRAVPPDHVEVIDNAGTSATGWTFLALYGYTPLEHSGGVFQNKALPPIWDTTNTSSIWGMSGDVPIWALRNYFPSGQVTSPASSVAALHEFLPVVHPELSAATPITAPSIWGMTSWPVVIGGPVETDPDADFRAGHFDRRRRWRDFCIWNTSTQGQRGPVEIEDALDLDLDGLGLPATYAHPLVHGHRYRAYDVRHKLTIRSRFGARQVKLSKLRLSRWIRNKKWEWKIPLSGNITASAFTYTFSPAPEIIGTPVAAVTVVDESLAATTQYQTTITSLTATAIAVTIHEVDTTTGIGSAPTTVDTYLNITLMGY